MPLVLIAGTPCSGKSTLAKQLVDYMKLKKNNIETELVTDEDFFLNHSRNQVYLDSSKEKQLRGFLKSTVQRKLRSNNLVILDAANYIKGFRYELYCLSKEHKSTYCVLQVILPKFKLEKINDERTDEKKYSSEVLDALILRYEGPNQSNRWDSPLFNSIQMQDNLEQLFENIRAAVFDCKPPPPNVSTQSIQASASNFLYEVDEKTKKVVNQIVSAIQSGQCSSVKLPDCDQQVNLKGCSNVTLVQLNKQRRLFITFIKSHPVSSDLITATFVQYLNTYFTSTS